MNKLELAKLYHSDEGGSYLRPDFRMFLVLFEQLSSTDKLAVCKKIIIIGKAQNLYNWETIKPGTLMKWIKQWIINTEKHDRTV